MISFTFVLVLINLVNFSSPQDLNITIGTCILQYSKMCESDYVKFYISTSDYPNRMPFLFPSGKYSLPDWVAMENDFKIIIHGYGGGTKYNQTNHIQKEYLKRNKTNIIVVNWGKLAVLPCYTTSAINTEQAGECIANFLYNLGKTNKKFNPSAVHLIGFSLGAHVAGFASNTLKTMTGKPVQRITGLDPALPFFATKNINKKLDKTDADFVDAIHTNAGTLGKIEPTAHADFYVNGGQAQPQCNESSNVPYCSHMLSVEYFAESIITSIGFWGVRCTSYFQYMFGWCGDNSLILNSAIFLMGEKCKNTTRGIIFVFTNMKSPYAAGRKIPIDF